MDRCRPRPPGGPEAPGEEENELKGSVRSAVKRERKKTHFAYERSIPIVFLKQPSAGGLTSLAGAPPTASQSAGGGTGSVQGDETVSNRNAFPI